MKLEMLEKRRKEHWRTLNINDFDDLIKHIKKLFEKHCDQGKVVEEIYRTVLPDWDRIKKVCGYPECGTDLSHFIVKQFMDFDKKYHPDFMPGGAWLNNGFSVNRNLSGAQISFENCTVTMT